MAIYNTKLIGRRKIAEGTIEISLERPKGFSFKAGQYIQLAVPRLLYGDFKGNSRVLSIASSPLNKEEIVVAFRDTGSGFKKTIKDLAEDAPLLIQGPYGFFTLPEDPPYPIVFVAGGIGITPYLSMIRLAAERNFTTPITLLYANRSKESAAYLEELEQLAREHKNFTFKNRFGRIDEKFIEQNVKDITNCAWHIAGPPPMVDSMRNILMLLGVKSDKVYTESFTGY